MNIKDLVTGEERNSPPRIEVRRYPPTGADVIIPEATMEQQAKMFKEYMPKKVRTFVTGATRDTTEGKHDYEGYLSSLVLRRFAEYMTKHRIQPDGQVRASDNWQKGIPREEYIKSAFRHFMDWWLEHRHAESREGLETALCGLMFNVMGYLHEHLRVSQEAPF